MKKAIVFSCIILCSSVGYSQVAIPLSFTSEEDNKVLQETDSGKYYKASGTEERTVFLNEDMHYRIFDKDNKLLAEGNVSSDGDKYLREGKWTEYYNNGAVKSTGLYYKDNAIGTWQKYYSNGKLMTICNYALIENGSAYYCMSGTYEEFFENGQLKISGLYKGVVDDKNKDTITIQDPETGKNIKRVVSSTRPRPQKFGTWEYYNEKGELVKKDELQ